MGPRDVRVLNSCRCHFIPDDKGWDARTTHAALIMNQDTSVLSQKFAAKVRECKAPLCMCKPEVCIPPVLMRICDSAY